MGLKDTLIHVGSVLGLTTLGDETQGYPPQQQPMDGYAPMQEQPPQDGYYPQGGQQPYPQQPTTQYQPQQGQNPYGYGQQPQGQHRPQQQQQQKGGGFQQGYQPPRQPRNARQQPEGYPPQQQEPYQTQAYGEQTGYGIPQAQQRPRQQEPPPQHQQKRQPHQILIVHVRNVEDAQQYIQALLGGYTVLLNLDGADQHVAQRVIDQLTGATFALGGTLAPVTPYVFVLTSSDTKITDSERARARAAEYPPQQRRR